MASTTTSRQDYYLKGQTVTLENYLLYVALVIVITLTPGPAILFIMTNSMLHGPKKTFFIATANIFGLFCLGAVTVSGLGVLIQTSQVAFDIIKYIGAVYLIYLGYKLLVQKNSPIDLTDTAQNHTAVSSQKLFARAYIVAISNPKSIVFLTALLPQFIDTYKPLVLQFAVLIFTLMFFSFVFLMLFALLAYKARVWLSSQKRVDTIYKTSGGAFVLMGLLLATSSNK